MKKGHYISSALAGQHSARCGCPDCQMPIGGFLDDLVQKVTDTADLLFGDTADTSDDTSQITPANQTKFNTSAGTSSTTTSTTRSTPSGSGVRASVPAASTGGAANFTMIAGIGLVAGALFFLTRK